MMLTSRYRNLHMTSRRIIAQTSVNVVLKAKKTRGVKSCMVINVYQLDITSIKKATDYHNN